MDNREGEFAFGQIFTETLVGGVFGRGQVEIVVADLEERADKVDERDVVSAWRISQCMVEARE